MSKSRSLLYPAFALLLAGCVMQPLRTAAPPALPPLPSTPSATGSNDTVVVPERYVSAEQQEDELDSLITWPTEDGHTWLIATAKSTHRLVVFDADTGERLREVGGLGDALGQFHRPNGIAVFGDHLFVTERDSHRVQVLSLPDLKSLGTFGEQQLRSPYGLWINESAPGELDVYVTDSFMDGARFDVVPAFDQLDQRVRRYRVSIGDDGGFQARYDGAFGDTSKEAALRIVESIAGDPASDRLLIADEDRRHLSTLREYTFAGRYTGRSLPRGSFEAEAEGIALWSCSVDAGYWVAVDQSSPLTRFHLFDRRTLEPRGSFTGRVVAETDGIALQAAATRRFPSGALFAVHDDKAVAAFDLHDIADALHLDPACLP
ncbi:MAG: phytase [Luteimonas sp.]